MNELPRARVKARDDKRQQTRAEAANGVCWLLVNALICIYSQKQIAGCGKHGIVWRNKKYAKAKSVVTLRNNTRRDIGETSTERERDCWIFLEASGEAQQPDGRTWVVGLNCEKGIRMSVQKGTKKDWVGLINHQ